MEHTTSKRLGSCRSSSADVFLYSSLGALGVLLLMVLNAGSREACVDAIPMFELEASIPRVLAPSRERLYF